MKISPKLLEIFLKGKESKSGCLFCNPNDGMSLYETNNFRVLVDTFPINLGHVMISSRAHYGAAGALPENLQKELILLKNDLKRKMLTTSGTCVFYEHGRAGCCMSTNPEGNKCEHFHLHCIPINVTIQHLLQNKFRRIQLNQYIDIFEMFNRHGNYLYFEDPNGNMMFYPAEDCTVDSHLLRTLICNALGVSHRANWQEYKELELYLSSYNFSENTLKLDIA